MASLTTFPVHYLALDEDELELIHNLLYSGPRLGHGYYSDLARDLLIEISAERGEIEWDDRLFDYGDDEGHIWVRREPLTTT